MWCPRRLRSGQSGATTSGSTDMMHTHIGNESRKRDSPDLHIWKSAAQYFWIWYGHGVHRKTLLSNKSS